MKLYDTFWAMDIRKSQDSLHLPGVSLEANQKEGKRNRL